MFSEVRKRDIALLLVPALVVALGLSSLRLLVAGTVWAHGATWLKPLFLIFLAGFLAPLIWAALGPRWGMLGSVFLVVLGRFALQMTRVAGLEMLAAAISTVGFLLFLPLYLAYLRALAGNFALIFGRALLLGLSLHAGFHALGGTLDWNWSTTPGAQVGMTGLVLLTMYLAIRIEKVPRGAAAETGWGSTLSLFVVGPWLVMQWVLFQSPGLLAARTGLSPILAGICVGAGYVSALYGYQASERAASAPGRGQLAGALLLLLASVVALGEFVGVWLVGVFLGAQWIQGWALAVLFGKDRPVDRTQIVPVGAVFGLSGFLILGILILYYAPLLYAIPVPRMFVMPAITLVLGLSAVVLKRQQPDSRFRRDIDWSPIVLAGLIALAPLFAWRGGVGSSSASAVGGPVRVLTYNIHSAYGRDGRQNLEAIAAVLETSGADIIALQEVSRGWPISGQVDMVAWLAQRLNMQAVFKGTGDEAWGNAILSRYPIVEHGWGEFPQGKARLPRGYIWARIAVPQEQPLWVFSTHWHHDWLDHETKLLAAEAMLQIWQGAERTVFMGDFNAWPGTPEIVLLKQGGMVDAWEEKDLDYGGTLPGAVNNPRIDFVWHSPDLVALSAEQIDSQASDHRPVLADLAPAP